MHFSNVHSSIEEKDKQAGVNYERKMDSNDSILFESTAGQMVMTQALWSGNG